MPPENPDLFVEERVIWQPDSWLLQRCWQALADAGMGAAALLVAAQLEGRSPLARMQALYRLAQQTPAHPELRSLLHRELQQARPLLFGPWLPGEEHRQADRLLLASATAAHIGDTALAFACLERADQQARVWDRVLVTAELRSLLAEVVARVGLHPLTGQLVTLAIRRYEESGAQFLHQLLSLIGPRVTREQLPRRTVRLMQRCVDTFQFATLTSLTGRRLAASAFGQAGMIGDLLGQLTTIANVQEARRDSGLSSGRGDPYFLRQVKRPAANPDVDFQAYTLQEAIRMMPVRSLPRDQRITLADQLAVLAIKSDGWTAAGAAASLIDLGALKYAVDVVDHIPAQDPTRSEGVITLVRSLLAFGDPRLAEEQVQKALVWLKSLEQRNPERATIWGLAEVYLEYNQPDMALRLLDFRDAPPSLTDRLRRIFRNRVSDDQLRDNRLRFQAYLQRGDPWGRELQSLFDQLCQWAPRLLDGEVLMGFYIDGLLRPLLNAGRTDLVWRLLPQVRDALTASSGDKHTAQVQRVATLLAERAVPRLTALPAAETAHPDGNAPTPDPLQAHAALAGFMLELWQADTQKGLWQTIHGIEGSLPLLLALEGPEALLGVAQAVALEGAEWSE
jgi:hypothetical protein